MSRGREILHLQVYFPNIQNSQGWTKSMPIAKNAIWVYQVRDTYSISLIISRCLLTYTLAASWNWKWSQVEPRLKFWHFYIACEHMCLKMLPSVSLDSKPWQYNVYPEEQHFPFIPAPPQYITEAKKRSNFQASFIDFSVSTSDKVKDICI